MIRTSIENALLDESIAKEFHHKYGEQLEMPDDLTDIPEICARRRNSPFQDFAAGTGITVYPLSVMHSANIFLCRTVSFSRPDFEKSD
jgi:hypothetical protein